MPTPGRPIIIKKVKKGGHGAAHGGAWKVAYADFVTAMMAFFLVMWIVGLSESTRRAIAGYFREPGVFEFLRTRGQPMQIRVLENVQREGDGSGMQGDGSSSDVVDIGPMKQCPRINVMKRGEQEKLVQLQDEVKKEIAKLANGRGAGAAVRGGKDLRKLLESVQLEISSDGLRIELADSTDLAYFDSGGATPSKIAEEVLHALAPKLAQLGNQVVLEGHTDTVPYVKGSKKSNWELSVERANAARTMLIDAGLRPDQIASVTGYGDRRLRKPEAPTDVANRRVSVVVLAEKTSVTPEPVPVEPIEGAKPTVLKPGELKPTEEPTKL